MQSLRKMSFLVHKEAQIVLLLTNNRKSTFQSSFKMLNLRNKKPRVQFIPSKRN